MSTRSNITIRPARLSDLIHLTRLDLAANSNHPLIALSFPYPFQRTATTVPRILLRAKDGQPTDGNISVTYDNLDNEDDDCSEMVTRNIFTWLRDEDGFPVAERAIREQEWIDNLDSDDDCPITGDGVS
jgi:hypothetical protein